MSETDFNCNKCDQPDTKRMVQCDSCDKWYHFECVGVNSDVANMSWNCSCVTGQRVNAGVIPNTSPNVPSTDANVSPTRPLKASSPMHMADTVSKPDEPGSSLLKIQQQPPTATMKVGQGQCAYVEARGSVSSNTASLLPTTTITTNSNLSMPPKSTTSTSTATDRNYFVHNRDTNTNAGNLATQTQLQLRMLEEEKELQRVYLEKKYQILLQGGASQVAHLSPEILLTSQPTASQIAARQVIPKELPNFDGNPEDWPLFISNFRNSTEIAGYSDGENLMRLQSCLRGRAKELVKSKLLIPSMVSEIIQTLEMCFGRPEHILDSMIERTMRIPPLKDKLESVIEYALAIKNICSTMESCHMTAHLNNPMLVKMLIDKLPSNHKLNWAMHPKDERIPVVKAFSDWIFAIAAAASQVVSPAISKKGSSVNAHQEGERGKPICAMCKSDAHKIQKCGEFQSLSLEARWNLVKEKKLCRQCLNLHKRKCFSNKQCGVDGCTAKHHILLHKGPATTPESSAAVNSHRASEEKPCFRILPIRIYCKTRSVQTYAFLDEGSSVTLMEQDLLEELGLKGEREPLELRWTGNTTRLEEESVKVNLEISSTLNDARYSLVDVRTVNQLGLARQSLNFEEIAKSHKYLKGLPVQAYENAKPTILIGLNNWRVAVPIKIREGGPNQPIATKTRLGWTLQGRLKSLGTSASLNIHTCECDNSYDTLHAKVKEYFALESSQEKPLLSPENEKSMLILEKRTKKKEQRFEVGLLWKDDNDQLPDSYEVARRRLSCLQRKFKREPELKKTMQAEIDKLVSKGYARRVIDTEMYANPGRTWYLPIFVTLNPNKPGKIRLVWDAAAKSRNKCLNDFLMTGPDLLTPLFNILVEFRVGQVAICGDIADMFHRIDVRDEDMHAQRFLWSEDAGKDPAVYVMKALSFGISCAPCIAHFVRNKNADEFRSLYPRAVKAVESYHYMDDFIDSVDSEKEALELAVQVKRIHAAAGFHMRNWATNSEIVRRHLGEDGPAAQNSFGSVEKILGMYWESENDIFQFICRFSRLRRDVFQSTVVPTKREVLQVLMSIFDPLGLVSHRTIGLKILLQDVWRSGINWDDELNDDLQQKWISWLENLDKVSTLTIPRCYSKLLKMNANVQLHTFVDAGEHAYSAVCYFRIQYEEFVDVQIVAAKSKVTPLKPISIPRLELQAAVLGTRLAEKIRNVTRICCNERIFWSDSKTVLKWLSMDPRKFKAFVMYRVGEILESTQVTQWNWVPSKSNPADLATKTGNSPDTLWLQGPTFLKTNQRNWPRCSDLGDASVEEMRGNVLHINTVSPFLINVEYFSCWRRLYRALSRFLFYVIKLKSKVKNERIYEGDQFECHQKAKLILIKYAQASEYSNEIGGLQRGKQIDKSSKLVQFNAFLDDDGVLRASGRATMLNCNKAIILPQGHYVSFLIVRHYHEMFHHCLHEAILSRIKSIFIIPKLRALYKTVRKRCQRCKNASAVPHPPQMATLPSARLASFERPFTYVGIDFFGPLFATVGRRREKRWGVLFTCLTIRAIHVEVAHSLDTSSCVMCIQNFISRRGCPREIYTDNGTNFKAVERILREEKQNLDLHHIALKQDEIKWRFNPPAAPHMGGAWERLVRSVKSVLYAICPAFKFNDESLRCALGETEFIINSRPLTFVALDSVEDDALTPNHLLLGSVGGRKPLSESQNDLRERWHQTQNFANHFWRRWVREYGPMLVRRNKWFKRIKPPSVGDIAVIVDDTLPRNCWPKGVITEIYPAKDGQVRRVKIKTGNSTYERPVAKIAILDVGKVDDGKLA